MSATSHRALIALVAACFAVVSGAENATKSGGGNSATPFTPIVLWHGMGKVMLWVFVVVV